MSRDSRTTRAAIIAYLMQQSQPKTAQEIAAGIQMHKATIYKVLNGWGIPGVVKDTERRNGVTRKHDMYYYDENAAAKAVQQYRNPNTSTEVIDTVPIPNNDLAPKPKPETITILSITGLHDLARKHIESELTTELSNSELIRGRLNDVLKQLDAAGLEEESKLVWLSAIYGAAFQHAINLRRE